MPVTVVVGGQFGSEGKGKVVFELAQREAVTCAIRVGGPNSGHTVITPSGKKYILRQLPTAVLIPSVTAFLPAGSYVNLQVLQSEIALTGIAPDRLNIHPNACVITQQHMEQEHISQLNARLGSTETGIGAAVRARVWRQGDTLLAKDCAALQPYVDDYTSTLANRLASGERAIIEGTQGFGLSLLHTPYYPFATSRDTTAAAFVSEAGLSPLDVDDIVLVLRAFPIRVPGASGPLPRETTWERITSESAAPHALSEQTSVTNRTRRVADFDEGIVKSAILYNRPTRIVLNHVDYFDYICADKDFLSNRAHDALVLIEQMIGHKVDLIGTGPTTLLRRAELAALARACA